MRNRLNVVVRRHVAALLERLESRQMLCATHTFGANAAAMLAAPAANPGPAMVLGMSRSAPPASVPTSTLAPTPAPAIAWPAMKAAKAKTAAAAPTRAAPGQANGSGNWGGGLYGAAAASFSTRADGLPILNSLPGAPFSVFLDFDGWTGSGYGGQQSHQPFDRNGNAGSFDAAEAAEIAEGWRRMAAYMAPFDVNVTTVQPAAGNNWSWSVIGNSGGGYSWGQLGSWAPSAFNGTGDLLGRFSGVLHELGHNFGLGHQSTYDNFGNRTAEYRGKIDNIHGVVMGVDYDGTPPKWIAGHNAGSASNVQDDLTVIANKIKPYQPAGGDGFRADDVGGTVAAATTLTLTGGSGSAFGVIERGADADVFSFPSAGGRFTLSLTPDSPSGLDGKLEVVDGSGTVFASVDDPAKIDGSVTLDLPAGTWYARVSGHGNYADLGAYTVSVAPAARPAGWTGQVLGSASIAGSDAYDAATGTWTVSGSGADVWGSADQGRFAYQSLTGDGSIVGRVASFTNAPAGWSKAGVDVRETTATGSKHVAMVLSKSNGPQFLTRASTGGSTTSVHGSPVAFAPGWVKLTRAGNTFTGYTSTDGVNWTQYGQSTVTMGQTVQIGLLVSSLSNSQLATATYTNVATTGNTSGSPVYAGPAAPTGLTASPGTGSGVDLAWDAVAGATGYTLERSSDGVAFATVAAGLAGTSYADGGLPGSARYVYRVSATSAAGSSAPSAAADVVKRPSGVTSARVASVADTRLVVDWVETTGETGYRVERSTDGTTFAAVGTAAANAVSYHDTGLSAGTTYYYRVVPTSALGDGVATAALSATTRLPAPTGLAFADRQPTTLSIAWNDVIGDTGYKVERSTNGSAWTTVTTTAADVTSFADAGLTAASEYYYRVSAMNGSAAGVASGTVFSATSAAAALPSPWSAVDVGSPAGAGATAYDAGTGAYTIVSNGADIWGTSDKFRFTHQPLAGNGTIVARVAAEEETSGWTKVGVMIRESTAVGSKSIGMYVTPGNGAALQWRASTNGGSSNANTTNIGGAKPAAPYWVKLVRSGSTFTGYASPDGATWTQVGQATISMATNVLVGLAGSSVNAGTMNTSTVDGVSVS